MRIDFKLPSLGADMESAVLTQWLKNPGDAIHRGEALAVVETAKGMIDIESFDEGRMVELVAAPGARLPVGAVLARIECEAPPTVLPAVPPPPATRPLVAEAPTAPRTPIPETGPVSAAPRRAISPAARRRAHELGISTEGLQSLAGTGVVHIEDVEKLAAGQRTSQAPAEAGSAMRAAIGAAMARSKREIPHYYLGHCVDFGAARDWLQHYNAAVPVAERLIEAVLIVKAVALAAHRVEGFSGFFRDQRFQPASAVHVGTAIALRGGGLVAPALLDAHSKDLKTLMREFSDLVTRVRSGHMRSGEFTSATITVTSLGGDGADVLYPIINPPQVAIIGAGAIAERPWVIDGKLAIRPLLELTVAGDHRVTDGRAGSRFARMIAALLSDPQRLQ